MVSNRAKFKVNKELLSGAEAGDPEAQFALGIEMLEQNRVGFALVFLTEAAKRGHSNSARCVAMYEQAGDALKEWRDDVLSQNL